MVPAAERPANVTIRAVGGDEHYDFPLNWSAAGTADTTWKSPKARGLASTRSRCALKAAIRGDVSQR